MCVILKLDLITDFIRIILQVFRGNGSYPSIIIQCLLVADRGSCYHKMSNASNAETMSIISLTCTTGQRQIQQVWCSVRWESAGNTEGSCRDGSSETGIMRERFCSEVEHAELMLGNHEKYHV